MKDKKAAKKIIKLAKKHPDWYSKKDVYYAKMMKKQFKMYINKYYLIHI